MKNQNVKKRNYENMNTFKVLFFTLAISLFLLSSCGGDDVVASATGCGNASWATTLESSVSKWSDASTNYANNPTSDNCKKYKAAGLDYVKAIKSVTKCIPGSSKKFYDDAIKGLNDEIKNINCN